MNKLCSNGSHFRKLSYLHLNYSSFYSTSSATSESHSSMVDFMLKSLGFSIEEASTVWNKVSNKPNKITSKNAQLVVDFLKKRGFDNTQIKKIASSCPNSLGFNVVRTLELKFDALEELGIIGSNLEELPVFVDASLLLASSRKTTLESKKKLFKSFGWSNSDIMTMLRTMPRCLFLSEALSCPRLEFFMHELGCEPGYLSLRCYVLSYSLESRVLPRYAVLKVLLEKKLIGAKMGLLRAVCTSEPRFLEDFVLPYKEELPELYEAYIAKPKVRYLRKLK